MTVADTTPKLPPLGPFVPPGQGKQSTRSRNLRRKRLRAGQAEQRTTEAQASIAPPQAISHTNAIPLGQQTDTQPPKGSTQCSGKEKEGELDVNVDTEPQINERPDVMMSSFGNKNKKKGYKQFLMAPVPRKIVFAEKGETVVQTAMELTSTSASISPPIPQASTSKEQFQSSQVISPPASNQLPRLVPPSEIQKLGKLPPNMFVTSVDVEADLWNSNGKKKGKKKKHNNNPDYYFDDTSGYQADEDVTLSYGEGGSQGTQPAAPGLESVEKGAVFDWAEAERTFDTATKVTQPSDLKVGYVIGWKVFHFP